MTRRDRFGRKYVNLKQNDIRLKDMIGQMVQTSAQRETRRQRKAAAELQEMKERYPFRPRYGWSSGSLTMYEEMHDALDTAVWEWLEAKRNGLSMEARTRMRGRISGMAWQVSILVRGYLSYDERVEYVAEVEKEAVERVKRLGKPEYTVCKCGSKPNVKVRIRGKEK